MTPVARPPSDSDEAWVELPSRYTAWMPLQNRDRPMLHQVPEAPGCAVHGPRTLALDVAHQERGWVCCQGHPPDILTCPGVQLPMPASEQSPQPSPQVVPEPQQRTHPGPPEQQPQPQSPTSARPVTPWYLRGPPATSAHTPLARTAGCYIVCPLASGCSGQLAQGSVAPVGGPRKLWAGLARSTSEPPMRSRRPHPGHFASCSGPPSRRRIRTPAQQRWPCPVCSCVLQAASASLPAESSVFLPWTVERCALVDGSSQPLRRRCCSYCSWASAGPRNSWPPQTVGGDEPRRWRKGEREKKQKNKKQQTVPPRAARRSHCTRCGGARLCTEGVHTLPYPAWPPKSGFSTARPGSGAVQNGGRDQRGPRSSSSHSGGGASRHRRSRSGRRSGSSSSNHGRDGNSARASHSRSRQGNPPENDASAPAARAGADC